jgi:DAACS family dicarboxylate/amino acid:cation (Na+ or H+) symporter
MSLEPPAAPVEGISTASADRSNSPFALWARTPLYLRIVVALIMGAITGGLMAKFGLSETAAGFKDVSSLILSLLRALATPLILLAILNALLTANIGGKSARRLAFLLVTNTMAAIFIGLLVANIVRPGNWGKLPPPTVSDTEKAASKKPYDPVEDIKSKIPTNVIKPLYDDNVIAVIILALTFGAALRRVREQQIAEGKTGYRTVEAGVATAFAAIMVALHWIIQLVPIAVFCVVAAVVGTTGMETFQSLAGFVVAVLIALALQAAFYISRVGLGSWVKPGHFLAGNRDALLTAFSTASSTVTMPITYQGLKDRIRVRERSAALGALVGSNFNNDGTALYEAMAPLFVAQALGTGLTLTQQIVIAFMAVVASVGAAGIPEAGLVTMLLVFRSVELPTEYVLLILPVDWFLDRCRTAINVMGDASVACLLDGKTPETPEERADAERATALSEADSAAATV